MNWRREKRSEGGKTYGRESMITAIFFLMVCQVRSRDFSCLSGGVTLHRMPRSWRGPCDVLKASSLSVLMCESFQPSEL